MKPSILALLLCAACGTQPAQPEAPPAETAAERCRDLCHAVIDSYVDKCGSGPIVEAVAVARCESPDVMDCSTARTVREETFAACLQGSLEYEKQYHCGDASTRSPRSCAEVFGR